MYNQNNVFQFESPPFAPIFHPNEDEFKDALDYIAKIKPMAESAGICKIVPPKGWTPPFCIDINKFKFTPRIQKLNELEVILLKARFLIVAYNIINNFV